MTRVLFSKVFVVIGLASIVGGSGCALALGIEDGQSRPADSGVSKDVSQSDGGANESGPLAMCDPMKPFGTPQIIPELSSMGANQIARLSADELRVVWASDRPGGKSATTYDLLEATRATIHEPFGALTFLPFNTVNNEKDPALSADGLIVVYGSDDPQGSGYFDLYGAGRPSVAAAFPNIGVHLAGAVNGVKSEYLPSIVGNALYFSSNRSDSTYFYRADFDPTQLQVSNITPLTSLFFGNAVGSLAPAVSPDEKLIYFSTSAGSSTDVDIWLSVGPSSGAPNFTWPKANPVTELKSPQTDWPSWISPDLCRLYMTSDRSGTYQIYLATRAP